jgi:CheY-like chemotaxis protein
LAKIGRQLVLTASGPLQNEEGVEMAAIQSLRRVLILDDEQIIANTLALILNRSGYEARAVYSAEAAIETARQMSPDFLISDVIMRGMTGLEAAIRIANIVPHCRIILFSGQAATTDILDKAEAAGYHFELLTKPVHPKALIQRLNDLQHPDRVKAFQPWQPNL